jgi:hypothetical protein
MRIFLKVPGASLLYRHRGADSCWSGEAYIINIARFSIGLYSLEKGF